MEIYNDYATVYVTIYRSMIEGFNTSSIMDIDSSGTALANLIEGHLSYYIPKGRVDVRFINEESDKEMQIKVDEIEFASTSVDRRGIVDTIFYIVEQEYEEWYVEFCKEEEKEEEEEGEDWEDNDDGSWKKYFD